MGVRSIHALLEQSRRLAMRTCPANSIPTPVTAAVSVAVSVAPAAATTPVRQLLQAARNWMRR